VLQIEFPFRKLKLDASYSKNEVFTKKEVNDEIETNLAPNHGPEHKWYTAVGISPINLLTVRASWSGQCGGLWEVLDPNDPDARVGTTFGELVPVRRPMGCYHFAGASLRLSDEPGTISLTLSANNVLDERPPANYFSFPELIGGGPVANALTGRSLTATLAWSPTASESW
jgi:hypothetical protein